MYLVRTLCQASLVQSLGRTGALAGQPWSERALYLVECCSRTVARSTNSSAGWYS